MLTFEESRTLRRLARQVITLCYENNLGHLNGALSALPIIYDCYETRMKEGDKFVLSCGHVAVAWYVVLERFMPYLKAEELLKAHGVHPMRCPSQGIEVSSGSLGMALTIALGMARATDKTIYCLISDGECSEGAVWEVFYYLSRHEVSNLKILVNANGLGALGRIDTGNLKNLIECDQVAVIETPSQFFPITNQDLKSPSCYLTGVEGHYKRLTKEEYEEAIRQLRD